MAPPIWVNVSPLAFLAANNAAARSEETGGDVSKHEVADVSVDQPASSLGINHYKVGNHA